MPVKPAEETDPPPGYPPKPGDPPPDPPQPAAKPKGQPRGPVKDGKPVKISGKAPRPEPTVELS